MRRLVSRWHDSRSGLATRRGTGKTGALERNHKLPDGRVLHNRKMIIAAAQNQYESFGPEFPLTVTGPEALCRRNNRKS